MSSALGVAATAGVLRQMLQDGLAALKIGDVLDAATPTVSCMPADRIDLEASDSRLNLFLYQQTRNPGWANLDYPSRDSRGERIASPSLAIDLYFLVTAYGAADFHAEVLLGAAMQVLHETPALGREAIRAALKPGPSRPNMPKQLELAGLADQLEQVRITPLNYNLDDLARLWAAIQVPLRPSAAYQVSVVLIDAARSRRAALPVTAPRIYVVPLRQPRIDRAEAADQPGGPILPSTTLRLTGANLKAPGMRVTVDGLDVTAGLARADDLTLELSVASALALGLRAGIAALQVLHPQLMGEPPTEHAAVESNLAAFVLSPDAVFGIEPGATSEVIGGVTYRSGQVKVTLSPRVTARQRVRLFLNEQDAPAGRAPFAYTFQAPDGNGVAAAATDADTVLIPYRRVAQGNYLARVQVDAGISPLTMGSDGRFAGPLVAP
jgi:hypothetical protein